MLGNCFASSGMDNTIKIWALDTPEVQEAVRLSYTWVADSRVPFHTCFVQVRGSSRVARGAMPRSISAAGHRSTHRLSAVCCTRCLAFCPAVA
jgi:hypothetical protein